MTDWDKSTGSSGTMRIRDTGTTVEFWINAGNSTTFNHELPWKFTVNGVTSSWREYDYKAGSGFEKLDGWTVTSDQTVTFYLGDTNTSGLGGPTTFSHFIDRASAPNPPSACALTVLDANTIRATFSDGSNNGSAIDSRVIGYGRNSGGPEFTTASDGSTDVGALAAGTLWYFWARTHNAKGYSNWGPRSSATTWRVPDAPSRPELSEIAQTTMKAIFVGNGSGGTPVLEWQLGYGLDPNTPQLFLTSTGTSTVTGLSPGRKYYFWARGRNSVGWGPWSEMNYATSIPGGRIKVGAEWKSAVPYVKVDGVWRVARPWVRVAGTWRETL